MVKAHGREFWIATLSHTSSVTLCDQLRGWVPHLMKCTLSLFYSETELSRVENIFLRICVPPLCGYIPLQLGLWLQLPVIPALKLTSQLMFGYETLISTGRSSWVNTLGTRWPGQFALLQLHSYQLGVWLSLLGEASSAQPHRLILQP